MRLKLIVLRTAYMEKLVAFYSLLGMQFNHHKHGNSPYHYSANIGETVLEIYPLAKGQAEADNNLRLGFAVGNFDEIIQQLGSRVITPPADYGWGIMAIAQDTDGRKVEIYK